MLAFTNSTEKQSPTVIGAGCKLTGNIKTDHTVQIHGEVIGDIVAETVVIGRGGYVIGEIKTPVLVTENGKTNPLILKTIMPEVDKIIVVASGAKNTNVKLEILRAVQAIYSISNIQIFAGN